MKTYPWPGGARCVVTLSIDSDGPCCEMAKGVEPLGVRGHGRYTLKHGLARYADLFARQRLPATFFICGHDAESNPGIVEAIAKAGFEIASHTWLHHPHPLGEEEPDDLKRTHDILTGLTGTAPVGWRYGHKSARTMSLLREMGYRYDSSEKDHDYPYMAVIDGEVRNDFVVLPNNTSSLDDFPFYSVSKTPPSEVLEHWKQEFDATYREGGCFNFLLHPRLGYGSGSPARMRIFDQLIDFMKGYPGVAILPMKDLADWCLENPSLWQANTGAAHV